ncbi:hypothetical protein HDU97_003544 [Phlyctochytrium planicorne]|nr:hypothetical protein HDU97_003544 [Phlyctochytrium planicorne]
MQEEGHDVPEKGIGENLPSPEPENIFQTPLSVEPPNLTLPSGPPSLSINVINSNTTEESNPFSTPTIQQPEQSEAITPQDIVPSKPALEAVVREEASLAPNSSVKNTLSKRRVSIIDADGTTVLPGGEFTAPADAPPLPVFENAYINPLFAGSTTLAVDPAPASAVRPRKTVKATTPKKAEKKGGPRRMSLGAALCIPPPPRIDNNMNPLKFLKLSLGAIGMVFGDIGVSPLFFMKAVFSDIVHKKTHYVVDDGVAVVSEDFALDLSQDDIGETRVLGTLSFLLWVITLVCCIKYIVFVLKADKNGEGGTWALVSLLPTEHEEAKLWKYRKEIFVVGIVAAAFLLADGIIAPSISVLSAFEGIKQYSKVIPENGIIGLSCSVLFILIMSQRYGTSKMLQFYGPIMVVWFLSIAAIGLFNISKYPIIVYAVSPHHFIRLLGADPALAFKVASEVFVLLLSVEMVFQSNLRNSVLAVTGVEMMYSDLGHFKTLPIRISFLALVYPAIVLNYLGQGAVLILNPNAASHPFFASVPSEVKWIVLILATLAAIIASQATISGCFTLIDQGISLRVVPNIKAIHVDTESAGAVYIPAFNYIILVGSIMLVLIFRDSERLAGIYGVGNTLTMTCTTVFYTLAMKYTWNYADWQTGLFGVFIVVDLLLLCASVTKVTYYGWISLLIGMVFFGIMYTWYITTLEIQEGLKNKLLEMSDLRSHVKTIHRTKGTVVFVSNTDEDVPNVLRICAEQLRSLPENIVCMSAISSTAPFIADEERTVFRTIDAVAGIYRLVIMYGYAERTIDTVTAVERSRKRGLRLKPDEKITFVVGREIVAPDTKSPWYQKLRTRAYTVIGSNTEGKIEYYNLPPAETLEIGSQMILGAEIEEEEEMFEEEDPKGA